MTNALPVHRMDLRIGDRASAPAAYVRADPMNHQIRRRAMSFEAVQATGVRSSRT